MRRVGISRQVCLGAAEKFGSVFKTNVPSCLFLSLRGGFSEHTHAHKKTTIGCETRRFRGVNTRVFGVSNCCIAKAFIYVAVLKTVRETHGSGWKVSN